MATATKAKPASDERFLTIFEMAAELKISDRTIRIMIDAGQIRAVKISPRVIRIPRTELDRIEGLAQ